MADITAVPPPFSWPTNASIDANQNTPIPAATTLDTSTVTPVLTGTSTLTDEQINNSSKYREVNPLDDYINVKQNITLSLVKYDPNSSWDFINLKKQTSYLLMSSDLSSIATATGRHYQITGLEMKNIVSQIMPTEEVGQVVESNMTVTEVYGLSLYSEINRIASTNGGYAGMAPANIVWRLDVFFSGFKSDGAYVEKIPFIDRYALDVPNAGPLQVSTATFFMIFTNIEAEMESGNTTYKITMIPFAQRALSSEFLLLPYENQVPLKDGDISFGGATEITFELYAATLEKFLNAHAEEVRKRVEVVLNSSATTKVAVKPLRQFKIVIPESLKGNEDTKKLKLSKDFFNEQNNSMKITGNNILTEIQAKLALVPEVQNGTTQLYPARFFPIKTFIDYHGSSADEATYDISNITVYFIIYDQYDYRYSATTQRDMDSTNATRFEALNKGNSVRRKYEYMFSSANSEIISFKTAIKTAWYNSIQDPYAGIDANTKADSSSADQAAEAAKRATLLIPQRVNDAQAASLGAQYNIPAATGAANARMSETRPVYTGQKAPSGKRSKMYGDLENVRDYNAYLNNFYTNVDNDNIKDSLQTLEVRGDPRWLITIHNSDSIPSTSSTVIFSDLVYIEVRQPSQTEYMAFTNLSSVPKFDADFSAFYQITAVNHTFQDGKYTQKFEGYRLIVYDPAKSPALAATPNIAPGATAPTSAPPAVTVTPLNSLSGAVGGRGLVLGG